MHPLVSLPTAPLSLEAEDVVRRLLGVPLRIFITVVVAILVMVLLRFAIRRATKRLASGVRGGRLASTDFGAALLRANPLAEARRSQRAHTVGSVLVSLSNVVVISIAGVLILDALHVNIAPFIASAGIVGVALGFGAQTLVKDFLSGIFMLLEDQYGVGDVIQVGDVSGTVESVALRVTTVRDYDGTLWYIRNGEILSVGNKTQGWARAIVNVDVPYDADLDAARDALQHAIDSLVADPDVAPLLQETPSITGVEDLTAAAMRLRIIVRTAPSQQWAVARAMRVAVRDALEQAGVTLTHPQGQAIVVTEKATSGAPHEEAAPPPAEADTETGPATAY